MAQMNRSLSGVETVFIPTSSSHSFIASRLLREVARYGGDVEPLRARAGRKAPPRAVRRGGVVSCVDDRRPRGLRRRRRGGRRGRRVAAAPRRSTWSPAPRRCRCPRRCCSRARRCLDLLDAALEALPEELKRARWVLADLDAMTEQRRREADALLEEVKAEAARLVSRTEIARQARSHAERVVADAEERGRADRPRGRGLLRPAARPDGDRARPPRQDRRRPAASGCGPRIEAQGPTDADAEDDEVPLLRPGLPLGVAQPVRRPRRGPAAPGRGPHARSASRAPFDPDGELARRRSAPPRCRRAPTSPST